jgi:hypothetical protein
LDGLREPAAAPVRAFKQEGDLVVIAPGWADPAARPMPLSHAESTTRSASNAQVRAIGDL